MRRPILTCWLVLCAVALARPAVAGEATPGQSPVFDAARLEFFEKQVRPVLVENCQKCHGPDKQEGGLRLDRRTTILAGGDSGPAVVPGDPDESLLIQAVRYLPESYQMPPPGKLPEPAIAALEEWVRLDVPWPAEEPAAPNPKDKFNLAERARHWSFQPVAAVTPPTVKDASWPRTPIDAFILSALESRGLRPAPSVDKATLLRRLTLDLTGLPPTPEEIAAFLGDDSPQACETVVDRLLASARYGERWARHWLDLVRYAEGHGHEFDLEIPHAFQYRDYVIRALNADVAYDQFVREHVAGDMLREPRRHPTEGFNESILGTGFFHLGEATHSPVDILGDEAERFDNQIDVFGKAFLGLTIACARCHDHKFDAISNKDYYALEGILQSSRYQVASFDGPQRNAATLDEMQPLVARRQAILASQADAELTAGLERLPEYLLAAGELLAVIPVYADPATRRELKAMAEARRLDLAHLAAWVKHLNFAALQPGDVFHSWGKLGRLKPEEFAAARDALAAELVAQQTPPPEWTPFENLDGSDFSGWYPSGEAFGSQPRSPAHLFAVAQGDALIVGLRGSGLADSAALSVRLRGALRSSTFTIRQKRIWFRASGTGQINVVVDSHRLIQGPLHGGTRVRIDQKAGLAWIAANIEDYVGHNAYIEILDEGPDAILVDAIGFSDGGPPPEPPSLLALSLLQSPKLDTRQALAAAYVEELRSALVGWRSRYCPSQEYTIRLAAVAWLIEHRSLMAAPVEPDTGIEQALTETRAQINALDAKLVEPRLAMAMADGSPEDCSIYVRGNPHKPGEVVPRRFLEAIAGPDQPPLDAECGRLDVANRLTDPKNPLVARVIVNRLWQHHFGRGIVGTPDNFGRMGEAPTNQPLLDWLAGELVQNGWSLKHMHRLMVLSQVYALASQPLPDALAADPKNQLWHYRPLQRLEAEAIRDAMLLVSGRFDATMYGPSVPTYLTDFMTGRGRPTESGPLDGAGRRSIYVAMRRNFLPDLLTTFDFPPPFTCVGQRATSNVPAQALLLLNNPFVIEQAGRWAARAMAECPGDSEERIRRMYLQGFGRPPEPDELEAALTFVKAREALSPSDQARPWAELAHVLFNVKEFVYVR